MRGVHRCCCLIWWCVWLLLCGWCVPAQQQYNTARGFWLQQLWLGDGKRSQRGGRNQERKKTNDREQRRRRVAHETDAAKGNTYRKKKGIVLDSAKEEKIVSSLQLFPKKSFWKNDLLWKKGVFSKKYVKFMLNVFFWKVEVACSI